MASRLALACIQLTAGDDMGRNTKVAGAAIRSAREDGAEFILTPENVSMMALDPGQVRARAEPEESHPALDSFRDLAARSGAWLLIGSLAVRLDADTVVSRSLLLAPDGAIAARYDKIHMFDVDLPGGERYRESKMFQPGDRATLAETPWGGIGMTVCYDLRFAALYRALAQAGAGILTVPSAFTRVTGEAHWHVLLRARAIETGAYVVAPAQCGSHPGGRETYGHTLVVDPWGTVVAEGGDAPGIVHAEIDLGAVEKARTRIPALGHDRSFAGPDPSLPRTAAAAG
jgi:predicted amidohydrolase